MPSAAAAPKYWIPPSEGASERQNHQLLAGSLLLHLLSSPLHHDELTSTVFGAIQQLNQHRKATFLLDIAQALALIDAGQ